MKRYYLLLMAFLFSLPILAQREEDSIPVNSIPVSVGFLSYDSVLVQMADYALVRRQMADLRKAYEEELKRVEDEFNQKYEAFLDGQKDFPRTILLKRQTELQQLLQQNLEFKKQGLEELQQQEQAAMAPLRAKINKAIAIVAHKYGLVLVVNTDANACPFIEPMMSVDISNAVLECLQ